MFDLKQYSDAPFLKIKLHNDENYHYGKIVGLGGIAKPECTPSVSGENATFRKIKHLSYYLDYPNDVRNFEEFNIQASNLESIKRIDSRFRPKQTGIWDHPLPIEYNEKTYLLKVYTAYCYKSDNYLFTFENFQLNDKADNDKNNLLREPLDLFYHISKNLFEMPCTTYEPIPPAVVNAIIEKLKIRKIFWLSDFWPFDDVT